MYNGRKPFIYYPRHKNVQKTEITSQNLVIGFFCLNSLFSVLAFLIALLALCR